MRLLLVEDDAMIGQAMAAALHTAGYAVDCVSDGQAALMALSAQRYTAVLLDLGLPKRNGFEVLRIVRHADDATPVLIVSARDSVEDRITGLDLGADDYVLKPFDMAELLARIRAVIRRRNGNARPELSNGLLTLLLGTREVRTAGGTVRLSAREFSLLHALMLRPGAILSRQELEERIYGWGEEVESNAVEFLIHAVRKKLGAGAIKNVRGLGWMVPKEE